MVLALHPGESGSESGRRRVAIKRLQGHSGTNHGGQCSVDTLERQAVGAIAQHASHHGQRGLAIRSAKRRAAGRQRIEGGAQSVHIRGDGWSATLQNLWWHVTDGTGEGGRGCLRPFFEGRYPEIGQPCPTAAVEQDVFGLQIPMQHRVLVGGLQGPTELDTVPGNVIGR